MNDPILAGLVGEPLVLVLFFAWGIVEVDARPRTRPGQLAALALLNRLTRIVPVVGAFALVGVIARPLDVPTVPAVGLYLLGWSLFYAAYWCARTF